MLESVVCRIDGDGSDICLPFFLKYQASYNME